MFVDLPVGPMAPARRMWAVTELMSHLKRQGQARATNRFVDMVSAGPPPLHALAGRVGMGNQRLINMVVSNLPGVQLPLYMGGARLLEAYPLLPLGPNMSVVICVLSYDGALNVGLVGDSRSLADIDVLARGVRRGFKDLAKAAGVKAPARRVAEATTA
jgi:hypothetical protein